MDKMKRYQPAAPVTDCEGCPADVKDGDSALSVGKRVAIQSHLTVQATEGTWNAVVTTAQKGTFLVRRLAGLSAETCPLHAYEIRHIAEEPTPE